MLVVCDYSDYYTKKQLEIISNLDEEILKEFSVLIKPHPATINKFHELNKEKYPITFNSISKLVNHVDLVFLSSTTTAALEFYALGIETICLLDQRNLNMSPLRNKKDVKFVSSFYEFRTILENYKPNKLEKSLKDVFYLNNNLSLWQSLIIQK